MTEKPLTPLSASWPELAANYDVVVIGAGLAGSEAALRIAAEGRRVLLLEQKPQRFSPAHRLPGAAELVCSNSFKSLETRSAHGLMKEELRRLGSPLLKLALQSRVPGGKALAVHREAFSEAAEHAISSHSFITKMGLEVKEIPRVPIPVIIASGPLTSDALAQDLCRHLGDESLYFYDATAPVVSLDSLDLDFFFWGNRHQDGQDYLNLPLTQSEYHYFREQLLKAEKMESHMTDELRFFEGCLPVEELASRGEETLAYSCMRPVGLSMSEWPSPRREAFAPRYQAHAVIQFRRERASGELLNMVGFQTRMKWPEQQRVFRELPGMGSADFVRLGAMHRNTFVNTPKHCRDHLELKNLESSTLGPVFVAGQISGSEGYTEAIASGHYVALRVLGYPCLPETSCLRSMVRFLIESDSRYFQPMNFNFGLLPSSPPESHANATIKEGSPAGRPPKRRKLSKAERIAERVECSLGDLDTWILSHFKEPLKTTLTTQWPSNDLAPIVTEHDAQILSA